MMPIEWIITTSLHHYNKFIIDTSDHNSLHTRVNTFDNYYDVAISNRLPICCLNKL